MINDELRHLAKAIDAKGLRVTFGLAPEQLDRIDERRHEWAGGGCGDTIIFNRAFWEDMGRELTWDPFALALWWFRFAPASGIGVAPKAVTRSGTEPTESPAHRETPK